MTMPRFTADASLYQTSAQYRTRRSRDTVGGWATNRIYSAKMAEEIEVFGCRPGFIQIGEGANMVCVDPTDPFGTRGHDGGGPSNGGGGHGEPGGGSGSGDGPCPKAPKCVCHPACAEKAGDRCRLVSTPTKPCPTYSCAGNCYNSEGNDSGACYIEAA
jgi:hypothetical protein